MAASLGVDTTLKNLRHYSATELISAGVDVRTVAGQAARAVDSRLTASPQVE
jgi:hypothetical protein